VTAVNESRWRVPLSDIAVDEELVDAVLETVRSGWWSMGPRVDEFEREVADSATPDTQLPSPTASQRSTWRCSPSAVGRATK